jgi:hypothetical protein
MSYTRLGHVLTEGLATLRRDYGISQAQLADFLGVSQSTIARAERGHVSLPLLERLVDAMDGVVHLKVRSDAQNTRWRKGATVSTYRRRQGDPVMAPAEYGGTVQFTAPATRAPRAILTVATPRPSRAAQAVAVRASRDAAAADGSNPDNVPTPMGGLVPIVVDPLVLASPPPPAHHGGDEDELDERIVAHNRAKAAKRRAERRAEERRRRQAEDSRRRQDEEREAQAALTRFEMLEFVDDDDDA